MDSPILCVESGLRDVVGHRHYNRIRKEAIHPKNMLTQWLGDSIMRSRGFLSCCTAFVKLYGCIHCGFIHDIPNIFSRQLTLEKNALATARNFSFQSSLNSVVNSQEGRLLAIQPIVDG